MSLDVREPESRGNRAHTRDLISNRAYSSFAAINLNPKCNANHEGEKEGKNLVFHTAELVPRKHRPSKYLREKKEQKCQINKQKSKEKELNNRRIIRWIFFLRHTGFSAVPFPLERFGTKERNSRSLINVSQRGWMMSPKRLSVTSNSDKLFTFPATRSWPWLWHTNNPGSYQTLAEIRYKSFSRGFCLRKLFTQKSFLATLCNRKRSRCRASNFAK